MAILSHFFNSEPDTETANLPTRVNDPDLIAHLFHRLRTERLIMHVFLGDDEKPFNSSILKLYPAEGYFLLDELSPKGGHERIRKGDTIRLYSRVNGVGLSFRTTVEDIIQSARVGFYRLTIPTSVIYRERRSVYRVRLQGREQLAFRGKDENNNDALIGEVVDISTAGCGIMADQWQQLEVGQQLPHCVLTTTEGERIWVTLEVRNCRLIERRNQMRVGGRFIDLNSNDRRMLTKQVRQLEREQRKRTSEEDNGTVLV